MEEKRSQSYQPFNPSNIEVIGPDDDPQKVPARTFRTKVTHLPKYLVVLCWVMPILNDSTPSNEKQIENTSQVYKHLWFILYIYLLAQRVLLWMIILLETVPGQCVRTNTNDEQLQQIPNSHLKGFYSKYDTDCASLMSETPLGIRQVQVKMASGGLAILIHRKVELKRLQNGWSLLSFQTSSKRVLSIPTSSKQKEIVSLQRCWYSVKPELQLPSRHHFRPKNQP